MHNIETEIKANDIPNLLVLLSSLKEIILIIYLFKMTINKYYCTIIPSVAFFGSGKFPNS